MHEAAYVKVNAEEQAQERSICGFRQRMLKKADGAPASITRLHVDHAEAHWHRESHEYYYILEGSGSILIDGETIPVQAGDCVWIKPGHMHQAVGNLDALIIGIPPFSEEDLSMTPPPGME